MTEPEGPGRPLSRRELRDRARAQESRRTLPSAAAHDVVSDTAPAGEREGEQTEGAQRKPATTLDDLFAPEPHVERPPKRRSRLGCLISLAVVLVLIGAVVGAGAWAWSVYGDRISAFMGWDGPHDYEEGLATGEALVTVSDGDTGESISQKLYDAGVTLKPDSFYRMLLDSGENPTFYPGVIQLQKKMTSEAALEALQDPANRLEGTVLLREGITVEATLDLIAESLELSRDDLAAAVADPSDYGVKADSLEGWLFPATYTFEPDTSAAEVIATLVDRTRESLQAAGVPAGDEQRVLTIASIIQREARFDDDFFKVSRVIQNRLDQGMLLQMDSTAQYGYGEIHDGSASTSSEAQYDDNPWNTYVHKGLPAGPIANPGDLAIDAAMHPADGPWLYFVTVDLDSGKTVFTTSLEEHEAAVRQWQEWCAAHPDSGC